MAGVLLAPSGIFPVYNNGGALAKWENRSELRVKALIQMELCQRRLHCQYQMNDVKALLFGDSMELAYQILTNGKEKKQNYFILDGNYEHFYYLTNNHCGGGAFKASRNPSMTAELNRILAQGLGGPKSNWHIENDAIDRTGNRFCSAIFFDLPGLHGLTRRWVCRKRAERWFVLISSVMCFAGTVIPRCVFRPLTLLNLTGGSSHRKT